MKELILLFLKKNWFKLGIVLFLTIIAFQDELRFNIDLKSPDQRPTRRESPVETPSKQEILSSDLEVEQKDKPNRFNLQPLLPKWRKKEQEGSPQATLADEVAVRSLAKLAAVDEEEINTFIQRFAHVAIKEQEKFGIPASVTIANGLILSTANNSVLARDHLNFFKLPCTPTWEGRETYEGGHCYRVYKTAWLSFRDHSNYLQDLRDTQGVDLGPTDYKAWAKFLARQNFAREADFDQQVIQLIEDMELFYLDKT